MQVGIFWTRPQSYYIFSVVGAIDVHILRHQHTVPEFRSFADRAFQYTFISVFNQLGAQNFVLQ